MPKKHQIIVFDEDLKFIGIYNSLIETSSAFFNDKSYTGKILRYLQGKLNELEGYIFLEFEGYVTAKAINEYQKVAKSRKLLSNIFKIDSKLIAKLTEEDALTIDTIIKKYI